MGCINKIDTKVQAIIAYGHDILRKTCIDISNNEKGLNLLIKNLWDTLESSGGVGLAAPQINSIYKVFVVNSKLVYDSLTDTQQKVLFSGEKGIRETFINAKLITFSEETWKETEGCLSIPGINEPVNRSWGIIIEYEDINFNLRRKQFLGYTARVIQHEYDHTNGILFIDHLQDLTKKLLAGKLKQVKDGNMETNYPIKYIKSKKYVTAHSSTSKRK